MTRTSPDLLRLHLGELLARHRQLAGLSGAETARRVAQLGGTDPAGRAGLSQTTLSRVEAGERVPDSKTVCLLAQVYGLDPATTAELINIGDQIRADRGWWRAMPAISAVDAWWIGLEAGAVFERSSHRSMIPGLLQTPAVIRMMFEQIVPAKPKKVIDTFVAIDLRRQKALTEQEPLRLQALIDESAIRRLDSQPEVRDDQIRHLLTMSELPNVSIHLLPSTCYYPGLDSTYILLQFAPTHGGGAIVSVPAGTAQPIFFQDDDEVARFSILCDAQVAAAATPEESREQLKRMLADT